MPLVPRLGFLPTDSKFYDLAFGFIVGIRAGVPSGPERDFRLGDVVVSIL
jgi:hypothetical protein